MVSSYEEPISRFITTPFGSYGQQLIRAGFSLQETYFTAALVMGALDQASRLDPEGDGVLPRDALRAKAVHIIIAGIVDSRTGPVPADRKSTHHCPPPRSLSPELSQDSHAEMNGHDMLQNTEDGYLVSVDAPETPGSKSNRTAVGVASCSAKNW